MPWRNNGDCGLWSRQPSSFGSSSTPPKKKTRNRTGAATVDNVCATDGGYAIPSSAVLIATSIPAFALLDS